MRLFVNPFQFHKQTDKASQLFTEEFPKAKQFNIKMLFHPCEGFVAMRCDTIPEGSPSHSQLTNHAAERMHNEEKKGEVLLLMAASQFTVLNDSRLLSFPSLCNTPEVILSNYAVPMNLKPSRHLVSSLLFSLQTDRHAASIDLTRIELINGFTSLRRHAPRTCRREFLADPTDPLLIFLYLSVNITDW